MTPKGGFLLILTVVITVSLAFDETSERQYTGSVEYDRHVKDLQVLGVPSQIDRGCICGQTSYKCCRKRRTLAKVSLRVNFIVIVKLST